MMQTQELYYPSSADYSFGDPMPDALVCHTDLASGPGGSMEVQLPPATGGGQRISIQNAGATYNVYVNASEPDTIGGVAGTHTVAPGQTRQLQGMSGGWKVK